MRKVLYIIIILLIGLLVFFFYTSEVTDNLDDYTYDLPFKKGEAYTVVQGYGGLFSHKNKAALDFDMPEGTPVYAARGGTIYSYKDDSDEGGPFQRYERKANYIIIRHSNGSYGCYWHLRKNGVLVKKGTVEQGQQIGYSGATGFVLRPHLHFAVKSKLNYDMNSFVRTRFRTMNGTEILSRGNTYSRPM
mgnify:CR=1 FL=1